MVNYLLEDLQKWIKKEPFIKKMFREAGVPLTEMKSILWRFSDKLTCFAITQVLPRRRRGKQYEIVLSYKYATLRFRHCVIHELNHFLRMHTNTDIECIAARSITNYLNDPDEIESLMQEVRFFKFHNKSKRASVNQLVAHTSWPREFVSQLYDLTPL